MNLFWYAMWFVVAVGLLVTVHEFGHFIVARRLGFRVLRFSVGFGRPLLKWTVGPDRIEYVVAAIPLGGYVKLLDEREGPVEAADLPRSFTRRPHWQRIAVLLAGPAFNILFAILVLWGMFWVNGVNELRPVVGDVTTGSLAARAGLRSGDEIRALNGTPVNGMRDVVFGLLDAMSSRGEADLSVVSAGGPPHEARLVVADSDTRRRLTTKRTASRRRAGLTSFPAVSPATSRCPAPAPRRSSSSGCSPARAPSAAAPRPPSTRRT